MKSSGQKAVLAVAVVFAVVLIAGCGEENDSDTKSDIRKHRLIAAENIQFKKDLEQCEAEIGRQKELLGKCLEEKADLQEELSSAVGDIMDTILGDVIEENKTLRNENERLKAQIEKLKKPER